MTVTLFDLLRHEIEHGTQRSVAALYAPCFLTKAALENFNNMRTDVSIANDAIIARWSRPGLERVKKTAWKIADTLAEGE